MGAGGRMDLGAGTALTCWVGGSGLCILGRLPKGSGSLVVLRLVRNLVGCSAVFHFASQADVLLREQRCLCQALGSLGPWSLQRKLQRKIYWGENLQMDDCMGCGAGEMGGV